MKEVNTFGELENMVADQMDAAGYDCFDEESIQEFWDVKKKLYSSPLRRFDMSTPKGMEVL